MKKNFLLAALFGVLSVGSSFSATTLKDTIDNIKTDVVNLYDGIDAQFNNVVSGWQTGVSFSGSLKEYVSLLNGAFSSLDLTNLTNRDFLAPGSTDDVRDGTYSSANDIANQLIKAIGYTSLQGSTISNWNLVAAPVADAGNAMGPVTTPDLGITWRIAIGSNNYDVLNSALPTTLENNMSISFANSTNGNLVFQNTGSSFPSANLLYLNLNSTITNWSLVSVASSPFTDAGNAMSTVSTPDSGTTWRITVNSHNYDLLASSIPDPVPSGTNFTFANGTYGNLIFQYTYTGASIDKATFLTNFTSSLLTSGVTFGLNTQLDTSGKHFSLPGSIFEAAQGLAQLASNSNIGLNENSSGTTDPNFSLSAAQRLALALNSAA